MKKLLFLVLIVISSLTLADVIQTESTTNSTITTNGSMETTVKSPPPSAISPQFSTGNNSDIHLTSIEGRSKCL